ncbi:DUF4037 domain-containing protein [Lutispora sp.]|nr:DUF4037 domain-containing protein [Lutispora sp.]MEA4961047.1 DUF4037 domain-containing protein [Lutispora sp.]HCJ55976.1 hypothetical protein [Clostridiaceae bacterium]
MKCLELTRSFYFEWVLKLIKQYFPSMAEGHSAALIGWGSEVLGNDDEISKFYGWGPKPKIFLSNEDYAVSGKKLWGIFLSELPLVYQGFPTRFKVDPMDGLPKATNDSEGFPMVAISTFQRLHKYYIGDVLFPYSDLEWLLIPEQKLLELTSGEVFYDGLGVLNDFRRDIHYYPDNVWKYKLAYQWTTISWELDLIVLCNKRGDAISARLSLNETVKRIISLIFLLNRVYKPSYIKWVHRQFYKLPCLANEIGSELESIFTVKDIGIACSKVNKIIETLIEYQMDMGLIQKVDFKRSPSMSRGWSAFDLDVVIEELKQGIRGELSNLTFPIGAVDQWVTDEDLLLSPNSIKALRAVYFEKEPEREQLGDKML